MFKLTPIAVTLAITTLINLLVTFTAWRRRRSRTGLYFALGMMGLTFWTLMAGLGYAAVPLRLKILFAKFDSVGYNSALVLLLLCAMYFAGLDRWANKKWLKIALILLPSLNILLIFTNEMHGWVWQSFRSAENNMVIFEHGPGFFWVAATGYLIFISMIVILWQVSWKGSVIQRRQAHLLLFSCLFPLAANIIYQYGLGGMQGLDWSSVTFSITGILFLLTLYFARFTDLTPIARDQLIASLGNGMLVVDTQNRIIDMNPAAEKFFSFQSSALIGTNLKDIVPPNLYQLFNSAFAQEAEKEFEYDGGDKGFFDVLVSPIRDQRRAVTLGHIIIFHNITERKKSELRFLQLNEAVEQSPASIVITNPQGMITYVNPQFTKLTGYTPAEVMEKSPNIVKSGQVPREVYEDMWQTLLAGKTWRGEFLNKKKNGELYWEQAIMSPVFDRDRQIINFIAIKENITERRRFELERGRLIEDLERRNAESESLRETTVIVTSTLDIVEAVQRILHQLKRVIAYDSASVWLYKDNTTAHLVGGDGLPEMSEEGKRYVLSEADPDHPIWALNSPYVLLDDIQADYPIFRVPPINYIHSWMAVPLRVRGELMGFISLDGKNIGQFTHADAQMALNYANQTSVALENAHLFSNLQNELEQRQKLINDLDTANVQLEEQVREIQRLHNTLREQVVRDVLTGLHNRRYLAETLGRELARAVREGYPVCFIMIDLDHFKKINDTYGHVTGDFVLQHLANQLQIHTRSGDIVCRYGGEEFLLVLPNTSTETAIQIANRLRIALQDSNVFENGQIINATISLGISEFPTDDSTETGTLEKADKALYSAKRNGRNQVSVWSNIKNL